MILISVLLAAAAYGIRVLVRRSGERAVTANVIAGSVVVVFIAASLAHPVDSTDASPPAAPAPTEAASKAPVGPVPASSSYDSSSACRESRGRARTGDGIRRRRPFRDGGRNVRRPRMAADSGRTKLATGICLFVDGRLATQAKTTYGLGRVDVANAFNSAVLANAGYSIVFPATALAPGRHVLSVSVRSANGSFAKISRVATVVK